MSDKRDPCLSCSLFAFDPYLPFLNHPLVAFIGLSFPAILARSTDDTDHSEPRATQELYIAPSIVTWSRRYSTHRILRCNIGTRARPVSTRFETFITGHDKVLLLHITLVHSSSFPVHVSARTFHTANRELKYFSARSKERHLQIRGVDDRSSWLTWPSCSRVVVAKTTRTRSALLDMSTSSSSGPPQPAPAGNVDSERFHENVYDDSQHESIPPHQTAATATRSNFNQSSLAPSLPTPATLAEQWQQPVSRSHQYVPSAQHLSGQSDHMPVVQIQPHTQAQDQGSNPLMAHALPQPSFGINYHPSAPPSSQVIPTYPYLQAPSNPQTWHQQPAPRQRTAIACSYCRRRKVCSSEAATSLGYTDADRSDALVLSKPRTVSAPIADGRSSSASSRPSRYSRLCSAQRMPSTADKVRRHRRSTVPMGFKCR